MNTNPFAWASGPLLVLAVVIALPSIAALASAYWHSRYRGPGREAVSVLSPTPREQTATHLVLWGVIGLVVAFGALLLWWFAG